MNDDLYCELFSYLDFDFIKENIRYVSKHFNSLIQRTEIYDYKKYQSVKFTDEYYREFLKASGYSTTTDYVDRIDNINKFLEAVLR